VLGHVATHGEALKVDDCYIDDRFDKAFDELTGKKTKSVLCLPIKDKLGNTFAVLQATDKVNEDGTIG